MSRHILAFGYHDRSAPRHTNVTAAYEAEGCSIVECHTETKGMRKKWKALAAEYRTLKDQCDTVLVTFPGHYLVPLAWWLTRRPRKKLIFDAFISQFDTLVWDRRKVNIWNPFAWFLYLLDFITVHLADEILIDTEAHKRYFARTFFLNPKRIRVIYVGACDEHIHNLLSGESKRTTNNEKTKNVLFFGTYIPLQGIEHILDAAEVLQNNGSDMHITLIGSGQTKKQMVQLAEKKKLNNVTFEDRMPFEELVPRIEQADLCLGIFGTSGKALRVIPHKVYDALACGVPVLTEDSPAIREKFADDERVILCRPGDGTDLAEKIERFFA